jgi:hypothetical protein
MDADNLKLLNKRIEILKNDIQDIINRQNKNNEQNIITELRDKKEKYLLDLNDSMNTLKKLKIKISRENEYKKVTRESDSMLYHRVKNKPNSIELMNELKQNREIAQTNFEKTKLLEINYLKKENSIRELKVPGFLFFHKEINDKYGLCPFIKFNDDDDDTINKRINWLDSQSDKGDIYYKLYDKIISKSMLIILTNKKAELEYQFNKMHSDILSDEQIEMFTLISENITSYINNTIKTKKLKDKFKIIINNLTNLVIASNLQIDEYICLYYDLFIPINIPNNISLNTEFINSIYEKLLEDYKTILEGIKSSNKLIINTENYLKQTLYEYLFNQLNIKPKISQTGKYFKKWSLLTYEEKLDRIESFSYYFIDTFLVEPKIIEHDKVDDLKISLKEILSNELQNIKSKHIKWNIKLGYLEKIHCLQYDNEKTQFYIKKDETILDENKVKVDKVKRPSSVRTILNKDNDKIINEELAVFIISIKNNKDKTDIDLKISKDNCIEQLKLKLKIKRFTLNDKLQIHKKFDDIYNVIINS